MRADYVNCVFVTVKLAKKKSTFRFLLKFTIILFLNDYMIMLNIAYVS